MKNFVLHLGSQGAVFSESDKLIEQLHKCISELKPFQKHVLQLRFWEEMTINQIAILTRKSWEQIDHLIEQTLIELRQMLKQRLGLQAATKEAA
jgi:DNA-directed RNA polymerase specialized sigma24 family protein